MDSHAIDTPFYELMIILQPTTIKLFAFLIFTMSVPNGDAELDINIY